MTHPTHGPLACRAGARLARALGAASALFVVASLVGHGCGSSAPEIEDATDVATEAPRTPPPPEAWLPPDADLVARVDVASLRRSPFFDTLAGYAVQLEQALAESGTPLPIGTGRLLETVDTIYVGGFVDGDEGVAVIRHRLPRDELDRAFRELRDDAGHAVFARFEERAGRGVWVLRTVEGMELGDGWLAIGTLGRVDTVAARRSAGIEGRGPLDEPRLAALCERIAWESDFAVVARTPTRVKERLRRRARGEVDSFAAHLALRDGVDGRLVADTDSPASAEEMVREAVEGIAELRGNPFVGMIGLGPLLSGLTVRAEQKSVVGTLAMTRADTEGILARLSGFVTLALSALASGEPLEVP